MFVTQLFPVGNLRGFMYTVSGLVINYTCFLILEVLSGGVLLRKGIFTIYMYIGHMVI